MRRTLCLSLFGRRSCSRAGCLLLYQSNRSYVGEASSTPTPTGLYAAIKVAKKTKDEGGGELVRLPEEYEWPISTTRRMHLFVRECYPALFELANNLATATKGGGGGGIVFTGNPGIGKSWFLNYLLWELLQRDKTVLVESVAKQTMWLFKDGNVVFAEPEQPRGELIKTVREDREAWYLFDPSGESPREPVEMMPFTIIAASPNPKHYKQFLKRTGKKYYIPTWSWEEIEKHRPHAAATVAKGLTKDQVKENFNTFGGIPRYVYKNEEDAEATKKEINSAIRQIKPNTITDILGDLELASDSHRLLSHKLLQYEVDPKTFRSQGLRYASDYVVEKVSQHLEQLGRSELGRAVHDLTGALAGQLFEKLAPSSLMQGGRFRTYCLETGKKRKKGWLTMSPRSETSNVAAVEELKKWDEVRDKDFVKCSQTFPVIDALSKEGLFNFTVAKRHSIKSKACKQLLVQLDVKEDKPVNFYWVVKDGEGAAFRGATFESITEQKEGEPLLQPNTTEQATAEFVRSRISQRALEIPTIPYAEQSVASLRELCRKKGLPVAEKKAVLIRHLTGTARKKTQPKKRKTRG